MVQTAKLLHISAFFSEHPQRQFKPVVQHLIIAVAFPVLHFFDSLVLVRLLFQIVENVSHYVNDEIK